MPPKTAVTPKPHMGRKIEKIRTLKGLKQETLAKQLGITQSALSKIERSEQVEDDKLQQIADALEMTVEALKNFNEDAVVNFIQNNNNYDNSTGNNSLGGEQINNFNPIEKYVEAMEENKKLYERLLESERKKTELLERLLNKK